MRAVGEVISAQAMAAASAVRRRFMVPASCRIRCPMTGKEATTRSSACPMRARSLPRMWAPMSRFFAHRSCRAARCVPAGRRPGPRARRLVRGLVGDVGVADRHAGFFHAGSRLAAALLVRWTCPRRWNADHGG